MLASDSSASLATVQAFIEFTTEAVAEYTSGSMDKKLLQLLANLWIGLEAQPFRSYFLGVALHHSTKKSEQSGRLVAMDLLALTRDRVLYSRTDDIFAEQQIPLLAGVLNLLRFATPVELGHLEAFQCSSPPGPPDQLILPSPTSGAPPTTYALSAQLFSAPGPFSRSTTVWQGQGEESELVFKLTWMGPDDALREEPREEPREVALYKEATMGVPESGAMVVPELVAWRCLPDRIKQERRPCVLCLKGRGSRISKDSISTVQGLLDFIESVWRSGSLPWPARTGRSIACRLPSALRKGRGSKGHLDHERPRRASWRDSESADHRPPCGHAGRPQKLGGQSRVEAQSTRSDGTSRPPKSTFVH
jgi:hypothetical protein